MAVAVITGLARPYLEGRLPDWVEPRWFDTPGEMLALAPEAEIAWYDFVDLPLFVEGLERASGLKWLNTVAAGVNHLPLGRLAGRGVLLTNGAGINAVTIAEYALMGMLTIAKDWRTVVRAQERHEWLEDSPGKMELAGSRALVLGGGGIGGRIAQLLRGVEVEVTVVRRTPGEGELGPDDWRARLGEFDWVIVIVPSTPDTVHMIGAAELAAMREGAAILNFARGDVIETGALLEAIDSGHLGAAFLDVTDPEPLPPGHPLWSRDNVHVSMHLSGRSQTRIFERCALRFLDNLERYARGEPLAYRVDLAAGY